MKCSPTHVDVPRRRCQTSAVRHAVKTQKRQNGILLPTLNVVGAGLFKLL